MELHFSIIPNSGSIENTCWRRLIENTRRQKRIKGLISRDRYEVRPTQLEFTPHANLCFSLHETGFKHKLGLVSLSSGAGWTRMSSDRFQLGPAWNFLHENAKSIQTNHWFDEQKEHCCWEFTKNWNAVRKICKNMALVSFRSHLNVSGNSHFGSGLTSYRSHVFTPWGFRALIF